MVGAHRPLATAFVRFAQAATVLWESHVGRTVATRTAGRLRSAGLVLALAAAAVVAIAYLVKPAWAEGLLATMAAELVTGREAAIPLAVAAGAPPAWIAAASILQNLALAALLLPLAMQSLDGLQQRQGFTARFVQGLQATAVQRLPNGRSAGALFLFMLLPFVANGALLAAVIGTMAAIPVRRLVAAIVAAVVVTATAWAFAYQAINDALARVHPVLALVPVIVAVAVFLVWAVAAARRALAIGQTTSPRGRFVMRRLLFQRGSCAGRPGKRLRARGSRRRCG